MPDPGSGGLEGEVELSGSSLLNKTYQDSAENFSRIQMCYKKKIKKARLPSLRFTAKLALNHTCQG